MIIQEIYDGKLIFSVCVIILIIGLLFAVFVRLEYKYDKDEYERQKKVDMTINWLYKAVNEICYKCNMHPIYEIKETFDVTHSEKNIKDFNIKGTINIVMWDIANKKIFSYNTLIYAALHEISHILSPTINHDPPFDAIESILLKKAEELNYYDPKIPIDKDYITMDL